MKHEVREDWNWSNQFIPQIQQIVGPHLLVPALAEMDQKWGTDLMVMHAANLKIAVRVRRPGYLKFVNEFTLRLRRASGVKTEYEKIVEGFGDWFFYGFAADSGTALAAWHLIDLDAFRAQLIRNPKKVKRSEHATHDGTRFVAYDLFSFRSDPRVLIGSSENALQPGIRSLLWPKSA